MSQATFAAVGYPKVGNTWLRLTLGHYLQHCYGLRELPLLDPGEFDMLAAAGCRAIGAFTHTPLEWTTQTAQDLTEASVVGPFEALRVVLLVRYPLDTLVSSYMQERHRNAASPFTGTLVDFLHHPVFGLDKLLRFYQLWQGGRGRVRHFALWRYEEALERPLDELTRLLEFLSEKIDPAAAASAVDRTSFANLRAMELSERQPVYKSSQLPIFATGDRANPNAMHNRRGKAGGYRDDIPPAVARELERRIATEMPAMYGYAVPPPA